MSSDEVSQKLDDLSIAGTGLDMVPAGKLPAGQKAKEPPTPSSSGRRKAPTTATPQVAASAKPPSGKAIVTPGQAAIKVTSPAHTCSRVKQVASAPDSVLAVVLSQLSPDNLASVHEVMGQVIKSIDASVIDDDVFKAKRRKNKVLPERENFKRRIAQIEGDIHEIKQQLAKDGALHLDCAFTICHDYTEHSVKDCIVLAAKLSNVSRNGRVIDLLARVELGKVLHHVRASGGDFISAFFKATGHGAELAYRYMAVADLCMSYPMLPFLKHATWSWLGQYMAQLREFLVQQDDELQAFLSQPPPTIAKSTIVIDKQAFDDSCDVNPYDGSAHVPDETLNVSDFDWSTEAYLVRVDGDCDDVVRARLRKARLMV